MFADRDQLPPEEASIDELSLPARPRRSAIAVIALSLAGCVLPNSGRSGETTEPLAPDQEPPVAAATDDAVQDPGTAGLVVQADESAGSVTLITEPDAQLTFVNPPGASHTPVTDTQPSEPALQGTEPAGPPIGPPLPPVENGEGTTTEPSTGAQHFANQEAPGTQSDIAPASQQPKPGSSRIPDPVKSLSEQLLELLPEGLRKTVVGSIPWLLAGLAFAAAVGAVRGSRKALDEYIIGPWRARRNFEKAEWLDATSLNVHTFTERDGKYFLKAKTEAIIPLANFFSNSHLVRRFIEAARDCTPEQPFPVLNFPAESRLPFAEALAKFSLTWRGATAEQREADLLSWKRDGLNRTNKFFREMVSSRSAKGIWDEAFGLPTMEETFVIIPVCHVRGREKGKSMIVVAIREDMFERFGSPGEIAKMEVEQMEGASGDLNSRIKTLEKAYKFDRRYRENHGDNNILFPRVTMTITVGSSVTKQQPDAEAQAVNGGGRVEV